jgi:tetratricopeptide (TPR) repeat protein/transcriptional regulator with XRE-family HTH domain
MDTQQPLAFGTLLRRHRLAADLTQEELAERAQVSKRSIGDMERGAAHRPRKDTVALLAAALNLSPREQAVFVDAARRVGALQLSAGAPGGRSEPPLVGRERELALLERHLAGEGPPLLLLAGEPGIGKSRLLQAASQQAAEQGLRVLDGGCQRRGGHEPYAPLQGALQRRLRCQPPVRLRSELQGCAWLVHLLPELAAGPIEPLPQWVLPPEQARRLMFEAVARLLTNIAGPAGVLLLLDDLQWAGVDGLDLLSALVRSAAEVPLRIVGAYRDIEVQPPDPLAVMLADLAHAGLATRRVLAPLAAPEAAQLLDDLLLAAEPVDLQLRERVVQRTGGVPFFLVSCATALRQQEGLEGVDGVPWDVAQSVRQRVAALPPAGRAVLDAAALAGRVVPRALLLSMTAQSRDAVLDALEAACRAHLLEEEGRDAYRFAHDLVREVVEADLSTARRAALHRQVAEALEAQAAVPALEALAYHYAQSDAMEKAVLYLEQAGDQARDHFAHTAAAECYHGLVERLDQQRRDLDAAHAREKLGSALWALGQYAVALPVLKRAAETYRQRGDLESLARATALIVEVYTISGAFHAGLRYLQPVLEELRSAVPARSLAELYGALARLLFPMGQYREQLAAAERAAELARAVQDDWRVAEATWMQSGALLALGRDAEGRRVLEETVRLTAAVGQLDILGRTLNRLAVTACDAGDLAAARSYIERALQNAERISSPRLIADTKVKRGEIAFVAGQWDEARADYQQAMTMISQIELSHFSAWAPLDLARLAHAEGAVAEAWHYLEQTVVIAERVSNFWALAAVQTLWAEVQVLEGQAEAVRTRLTLLLERSDLWPRDIVAAQATLAWAHLELNAVTEAEALALQASTRARAAHYSLTLADALRVQAMVLIRQERWMAATDALEEGLALAWRIPYPYAEGRLLRVYGQMFMARAEARPALERLEAALAIFRRLGARRDAEQADQAIQSLSQKQSLELVALSQNHSPAPVATSVTEAQWAQIQELLRPSRHGPGRPRADDRRILEAILYVQRTGCAWNQLPVELGDDATVHRRLQRWQTEGIWEPICRILGLPASAADAGDVSHGAQRRSEHLP